ncbi:hypothetical protein [Paenibacillus alba]|uniref:XkdX family protein n=1 Tax=Paenibacillus alba TaxID=1197127 RepID=A0ABU6GAH4_9BACL|nr:hypothetical protein [Paenibacillus alba]MEC0231152.1 hypothetical protein [Paenibacillus alba]
MTNFEAQCYAALAMKSCGFNRIQVNEVLNEMNWNFDSLTEHEVKELYQKMWGDEE